MKLILLITLTALTTSCGAIDRLFTRYTGSLTYKCSKSGVEYVQSDSGIALHVDKDGNPIQCPK